MATKGTIERMKRIVKNLANEERQMWRNSIIAKIKDKNLNEKERMDARIELAKNFNKNDARVHAHRMAVDGRMRGFVVPGINMSRWLLRKWVNEGRLACARRYSW